MCYICSCLSAILDAVQRIVTFGLACWMCCALCTGMIVASVAGIAYGYNYCMAEFLTLTSRSEVTVFMRRGKFYDPPDIKSPLVSPSGRRSSNFEQELNGNMSSDYDESLRRARDSKSLGDAWVKSDDTRRYAERLTKFSDNVESNDVVVPVHVTPSTTMESGRRENADDSGKYSANVKSYSGKINGDNDAERSKIILPSSTIESNWKLPELLSKVEKEKLLKELALTTTSTTTERKVFDYMDQPLAEQFPGVNKLVVESTPLPTTNLDTRYRTNVDNSWQFAEHLSKFVEEKKGDNNGVVRVVTPAFFRPTQTQFLSEFDIDEMAATRAAAYLNFLKPLRTNDTRKTNEDLNTKGRVSSRRPIRTKRPDSKIKFVERKHQDSKSTLAPMHHWATRSRQTPKASPEEYSSSEDEDEDIVYKSV